MIGAYNGADPSVRSAYDDACERALTVFDTAITQLLSSPPEYPASLARL